MAGKHILVVEDERKLADILRIRLESVGYQVHLEYQGVSALHYAQEHRPDLVLLDLKLPDLHGYEVCRQLRSMYHRWDVPIIMLTAMGLPVDELRGFAHGADAYLTKPCEPSELVQTVSTLLEHVTSQP